MKGGCYMVTNLRTVRKDRGLTQMELARLSHINRVTIARYEAGTIIPKIDNVQKLATALEISVDELIGKEVATA